MFANVGKTTELLPRKLLLQDTLVYEERVH